MASTVACLQMFQELQTTVASLVERGVLAESEIVAVLKQVLPEQLQQLIPEQLGNIVPQSPAVVQQQAQENVYEEPPLSAEQLSLSQTGLAVVAFAVLMDPSRNCLLPAQSKLVDVQKTACISPDIKLHLSEVHNSLLTYSWPATCEGR